MEAAMQTACCCVATQHRSRPHRHAWHAQRSQEVAEGNLAQQTGLDALQRCLHGATGHMWVDDRPQALVASTTVSVTAGCGLVAEGNLAQQTWLNALKRRLRRGHVRTEVQQ